MAEDEPPAPCNCAFSASLPSLPENDPDEPVILAVRNHGYDLASAHLRVQFLLKRNSRLLTISASFDPFSSVGRRRGLGVNQRNRVAEECVPAKQKRNDREHDFGVSARGKEGSGHGRVDISHHTDVEVRRLSNFR